MITVVVSSLSSVAVLLVQTGRYVYLTVCDILLEGLSIPVYVNSANRLFRAHDHFSIRFLTKCVFTLCIWLPVDYI